MKNRNKEPENKDIQAENSCNKKYGSLKQGVTPNRYPYYVEA
jgi:hypothetical protein